MLNIGDPYPFNPNIPKNVTRSFSFFNSEQLCYDATNPSWFQFFFCRIYNLLYTPLVLKLGSYRVTRQSHVTEADLNTRPVKIRTHEACK